MYAKIVNGQVEQYPYLKEWLIQEHPNVSFGNILTTEVLKTFNLYIVHPSSYEPYNSLTHKLIEGNPIFDGEIWKQQWILQELNDAERFDHLNRAKATINRQAQQRLDAFAKTKNYDDINVACTYANSTNATFKAEGQRCIELRDNTWSVIANVFLSVDNGQRQMPTGIHELDNELPTLDW